VKSGLDNKSALNLEYALRPYYNIGYNKGVGGAYSSTLECTSLSSLRLTINGNKRIIKYKERIKKYYSSKKKVTPVNT
jgi:hypothetical protein